MSTRIDKSRVAVASVENAEHDRCVDILLKPDKSFGFEEFRRDVEDGGTWTATAYYSRMSYASADLAIAAAENSVFWLYDVLTAKRKLRRIPKS